MAKKRERLPRIRTGAERCKVTICMSEDTDLRLTVWAKMRGLTRSELAERLLIAALAGVEVTVGGKPIGQVEAAA